MKSLYILGAGFSAPAGLPLGADLFESVVSAAKVVSGGTYYRNILLPDIQRYQRYLVLTASNAESVSDGTSPRRGNYMRNIVTYIEIIEKSIVVSKRHADSIDGTHQVLTLPHVHQTKQVSSR